MLFKGGDLFMYIFQRDDVCLYFFFEYGVLGGIQINAKNGNSFASQIKSFDPNKITIF